MVPRNSCALSLTLKSRSPWSHNGCNKSEQSRYRYGCPGGGVHTVSKVQVRLGKFSLSFIDFSPGPPTKKLPRPVGKLRAPYTFLGLHYSYNNCCSACGVLTLTALHVTKN